MTNQNNEDGNQFIKQISKLFEDLSSSPLEKLLKLQPRTTCTKLRRLREIRRELILDADLDPGSELISTDTVSNKPCLRKKNESLADWVLRNQQCHQQIIDKQNSYREELKNKNLMDANKTVHGFANFSPSALQIVAKSSLTPQRTLKWLAAHYQAEVRQALAVNENIGGDILNILIRDGEDNVREAVLDNKNITREALLQLCDDQSPLVAEKAKNILYQKTKREMGNHQSMTATANIEVCVHSTMQTRTKLDQFDTHESIVIEREFAEN